MCREIKFRAWDTLDKGFINGFNMLGFTTGQGAPCRKLQRYSHVWQETDSYILEQFTGFCDKNGKEICKGDIFKSLAAIGIVKQKEGCWIVDWIKRPNALTEKLYPHIEEGEIIGNIHENPELIKKSG